MSVCLFHVCFQILLRICLASSFFTESLKQKMNPDVCEIYKADSGTIRFKVRYPMGMGFATFALTSKKDPLLDLYQVYFGPAYRFVDNTHNHRSIAFNLPEPIGTEFKEFWMTWYNNVIRLGISEESKPVLTYPDPEIMSNNIGFVKFYTKSVQWRIRWSFEASPVILTPLKEKIVEGGHLHWVSLEDNNQMIPHDALIGGFEEEPLYIFRTDHNRSLCPGKYYGHKKFGTVAWGRREYVKQGVGEILCGYNANWMKTEGSEIPENAFVAGHSEVRREPLYIGRAKIGHRVIIGKVHPLYGTCYIPFDGKEWEFNEYEILVSADKISRTVPLNNYSIVDQEYVF